MSRIVEIRARRESRKMGSKMAPLKEDEDRAKIFQCDRAKKLRLWRGQLHANSCEGAKEELDKASGSKHSGKVQFDLLGSMLC